MNNDRMSIPNNLKWNTEHIYANIEEWEKDYAWVETNANFSAFSGHLNDVDTVAACFNALDKVYLILEKLYVYASMKRDEDTRDNKYKGLLSRAQALLVKMSSETSFIVPELTSLPEELLKSYIKSDKLSDHDYELKCILNRKPHVLSFEAEKVLALGGQVFGGYREIFGMINNADIDFPTIETKDGPLKVTHGVYGLYLRNDDRNLREEVFKKYYECFRKLINTITATYSGNVNKNVFLARVRNYSSCLDMALSSEDVSKEVYENLIESVHSNFDSLHRYMAQKKQALKLDEMHMWDVYVPIVDEAEIKLDYESAFKLVKEGLSPLGSDYQELLQNAHDEGWIDVMENPGKRSGAYSTGVYAFKHPYVLLNYQETTSDIFTIAHELGHAMHTYYSNKNQPKGKADYTIFVAEVASTVNEVLLLKYLLKTSKDNRLKKFLLSYYTDMIKSTLFRQTMFAEFEYIVHDAAEKGTPLTSDYLSDTYLDLNKRYYGDAVVSDKEISWEWARIPHFYNAFYVYKYATGIISAITIAERILNEGDPAVKDYKKFLSSGGSNSPVELLKISGVDLTDKNVFKVAMESFKKALDEFDSITI